MKRCRRLRSAAGALVCTLMGCAYLLAAWQVAFGMHIGHVVQDGVDTGDLIALPLVAMAVVSFGLAMFCADAVGRIPRRRVPRLG